MFPQTQTTFKSKRSHALKRKEASAASLLALRKRLRSSTTVWQKLDDYQKRGVEFAEHVKTAALLHEQGIGKTWILGGLVERLWHDEFLAVIVVPLNNLETTWLTFFRDHLPHVPVYSSWQSFKSAVNGVLIIHFEGLPDIAQALRRRCFTLFAYDEAQRLKARGTLASRIAAKLKSCAERKVILSGTPMDKCPQDLWAQFRFLAPHVFGTRWQDFVDEYLVWDFSALKDKDRKLVEDFKTMRKGSFKWLRTLRLIKIIAGKPKFDFDKLEHFLERIRPYALRVDADDVIDLPPLRIHRVPVVLRGDQRRMYDKLERSMVLRQPEITTPLKATQMWKLQQICGGYVIDDHGELHEVGRAKLRALKRIVKTCDRPVVVFCQYTAEIAAIKWELQHDAEALGIKRIETFSGRTKQRDRPTLIRAFQDGAIDVIIAQRKTGGVGIDLFRSHVGIAYSYRHSWIDWDQMIKRLRRRGQEYPVDIHLLYGVNTVDEDIGLALIEKREVNKLVLTGLKRRVGHGREGIQIRRQRARRVHGHSAGERSRRAA